MPSVLSLCQVSKKFRDNSGHFLPAVSHVSLTLNEGECCALVGESGCGKSTLAHIITGLLAPDEGQVMLLGDDLYTLHGASLRRARQRVKLIFQEPRSSFDPRLTIGESLEEALKLLMPSHRLRLEEAGRLLDLVGLSTSFLGLYPLEISGGECQRAAIARALSQKPRLLICDEATSALDVISQARIKELLSHLCQEEKMSIFFISHDLALVSELCSRLYVMYEGEIVEEGPVKKVISQPSNHYTQKLLESVFEPKLIFPA